MSSDYIIWGSGGHAKVIVDILLLRKKKITAIIDINPKSKKIYEALLINKNTDVFLNNKKNKKKNFVIAIGSNQKQRFKVFQKLKSLNMSTPNIIHPKSVVSKKIKIGLANQIFANCNISAAAQIGDACIFNNNTNIDHDCKIGNAVHVAPGAVLCGNITVGNFTLIGANSTVLPNLKIGDNCIIGAGSIVTKNIPDNSIIVNNNKNLSSSPIKK